VGPRVVCRIACARRHNGAKFFQHMFRVLYLGQPSLLVKYVGAYKVQVHDHVTVSVLPLCRHACSVCLGWSGEACSLFGGLVVWWFGGLVVWWFGGLVVWWFGVVVFWCCGVVVLWCCGVVVLWCCGVVCCVVL
jgi:hypothetical protein